MTFIITGKGSWDLIEQYKKNSFKEFELYVKTWEDLEKIKITKKIISIHQPVAVKVNEKLEYFDITDTGEIGKESETALNKTFTFIKNHNIKRLVIHGASKSIDSKQDSFQILKQRIYPLLDQGIEINFETDALWSARYKPKKVLLSSIDDFKKLIKIFENKVTITVDIEHLILTSLFNRLKYSKNIKEDLNKLTGNEFKQDIEEFFNTFKNNITHLHICGSDYKKYYDHDDHHLSGEHLPLGIDSEKKDRLDYEWIIKLLKTLPNKNINIVIEIGVRPNQNFHELMYKSKEHLEKYIKNLR